MTTRADRQGALRQAALDLAVMGYSVIPASGKKPLMPWAEFQSRRAETAEIEAWWAEYAGANVALVTGEVSGIIVLDIDGPEGHATLQAHGFEIPESVHARTARGDHYYFEHPGFRAKNFAGGPPRFELPKVDLRGDGGFVIAPPSKHPTGADYEWVISPFDRKPTPAPKWLLNLVRPQIAPAAEPSSRAKCNASDDTRVSEQYLRAALEGEVHNMRQARESTRNNQLNLSVSMTM